MDLGRRIELRKRTKETEEEQKNKNNNKQYNKKDNRVKLRKLSESTLERKADSTRPETESSPPGGRNGWERRLFGKEEAGERKACRDRGRSDRRQLIPRAHMYFYIQFTVWSTCT